MIIALDATPLVESTGGIARYTWELARSLAETFPHDEYWLLSDQAFPIPSHLPQNLMIGATPTSVADRRWWLWGLNQAMDRRHVELFHGTDFSVPYVARRPSVMTLHDLSPWRDDAGWQPGAGRVRRRTPRLLQFGLAERVITPSEAVRNEVIRKFSFPADRVMAVPLAAGELFRPVAVKRPETPYFLFVGTLEPRKNITRMIETWRLVRKTCAVDLAIAGRVREDFPCPEAEPGLRLLGAVPDAELPMLFSGAIACVYPSLYEGFGLPVLEAMQCGALVITSRDPAIMEVTGGHALHVDAENVDALADAMQAVALRADSFHDLRLRGINRAAQFNWTATARRTHEVYEAACRK